VWDYRIYKEVLGVDVDLAWRLAEYFRQDERQELSEIEGMTDDLVKEVERLFHIK
jgi:hypothetical protein